MKKTKQKKSRLGQYDAKYFLTGLNISEPLRFATLHRSVFNDLQKVFLTLYGPRPFYLDSAMRPFCMNSASTPLQSRLVSPVKQLAIIKDNLLAYGVKGRKATDSSSLRLAQPRSFYLDSASTPLQSLNLSPTKFLTIVVGCRTFVSKVLSDEFLRTFCGKKYEPRHGSSGIKAKHSVMEDRNKIKNNKALLTENRQSIIAIASTELGVKEATGNNDGPRVEQYLRYTNLGPGYDWCASFVSWVYGQAGFSAPRNPWSPALFPKARSYQDNDAIKQADLFSIYSAKLQRIHHVGLIKSKQGQYILTIEGNSNNRVESRRRHVRTVYSYADWVERS